jgi:O-antigen ligase
LIPRGRWRIVWITRGLAIGALAVCTVSLITRVLPNVWPTSPGVADNRLSYPVTYWNALGLLAAIGILLALGITSNPRENRLVRAFAAAGVPIAAATLFLTFSRGAIAALAIGLVTFLAIGRSRALIGALFATVPTTAVALLVTYHANLLDSVDPTTPGAIAQGRTVAAGVAAAALAAGLIRAAVRTPKKNRPEKSPNRFGISARTRAAVVAGVLAAIVLAGVAAGGPAWVSRRYDQFISGATIPGTDFRTRLTNSSSNGRSELWRVGLKAFASEPISGTGAGTYEFSWYRYRKVTMSVVDAHSLYVETLSELGLVGLVLLLGTVVAILATLARRARQRAGPNRVIYAALFSAAVAWALHSVVDWDWEMPVVTAWVFAAGGAALAARNPVAHRSPGAGARVPIAVGLLVVAVTPTLLMLSQTHIQRAANAFRAGNCSRAESQALASIDVLALRPEPYQILGYCDISDGRAQDAVAAMKEAVNQEPGSWEYHYGLAIADAYAGIDPRAQMATVLRMDPHDPLVEELRPVLRTGAKTVWLATARRAFAGVVSSGRLTLS